MVKHKNIIDFDSARGASSVENTSPLPQLVISAQRTAKHFLNELLPIFFSQIDNSLYDLAEKAENNQQQSLYFDAMREIRLQHELMHKIYLGALDSGFKLSLSQAVITHQSSEKQDQIGLGENEQFEESLAIRNMANAANNSYRQALSDLSARLNFLIEKTDITSENSPLRPEVLCNAFSISAGCLNTDIKVRLVVYKLFDKFVIQQLAGMYDTINEDLIASGVLPRLRSTSSKTDNNGYPDLSHDNSRSSSAPTTQPVSKSRGSNDTSPRFMNTADNVFNSLQLLLSRQRVVSDDEISTGSNTQANQESMARTNPNGVGSHSSEDIVGALSRLQIGKETTLLYNKNGEITEIIKTSVMNEINKMNGTAEEKQISQADIDSIDIVSRLFEFILDDQSLSDCLKVQIIKLQVPILKVAILDNDLFSMKSHPARQLLNELAYAGNGIDKTGPDEEAILKMVNYVVGHILAEFEKDTSIFENLLSEFTRFMENEKETNKLTEDVIEKAKTTVSNAIQLKVAGHNIPPLVNTILLEAWKDVLIHLYLRDGATSTAWGTALQVADDLIWSAEPKLIVSERNRLIKVIPSILNGLRDGFTLINLDNKKSDILFDELEELHMASLRGGIPDSIPEGNMKSSQQNNSLIDHEDSDALTEDDFGIDMSSLPELNSISNDIITSSEESDEILFSIHAETIDEMTLGTWVEFVDPNTMIRSRGKLAWKCDFTKEFTFVDRKYKVVADLTFRQLVEKFELEHAAIVEDIPLFDRALDSVIVGIKQALDIKTTDGNKSNH